MLNIAVVCLDPDSTGTYIPFGKSQLRAFAAQWKGFYLSRTLVLPEVTILMELWAAEQGRITLTGGSVYMESGFLAIPSTGQNSEQTYFPATVRAPPVPASPDLRNAQGHKLNDGDETWTAAGCSPKTKRKEISITNTFGDQVTLTRSTADFCEPTKILERKQLITASPPSTFTGKLRLYVQALYGSDRTDLHFSDGGFAIGTGKHTTNAYGERTEIKVQIYANIPTSGLFTVEPGKYLLIEIDLAGNVKWRKLLPFTKRKFKTAEHEAYCLATLTPDATAHSASLGIEIKGSPLAYGWHFNRRGDTAAMVTFASETIVGTSRYNDATTSIGGFRCRLYSASFSYSAKANTLTCSAAQEQSGTHIPFIQSKIWFPAGKKMAHLFPDTLSIPDTYADLSAVVYCFYQEDKRIDVVANNAASIYNPPDTGLGNFEQGEAVFGTKYVAPHMSAKHVDKPGVLKWSDVGFSCGGRDFKGPDETDVGSRTVNEFDLAEDNSARNQPNAQFIDRNGFVKDGYIFYFGSIKVSKATSITYNHGTAMRAALVIPTGDAEAVVLGRMDTTYFTSKFTQPYYLSNNVASRAFFYPGFGTVDLGDPLTWNADLIWGAAPSTLAGYEALRAAALPYSATGQSRVESITLFARGQFSLIETAKQSTVSDSDTLPPNPFQELFSPLLGADHQIMEVYSTYFGKQVEHRGLGSDPSKVEYLDGWPAKSHVPIGWV